MWFKLSTGGRGNIPKRVSDASNINVNIYRLCFSPYSVTFVSVLLSPRLSQPHGKAVPVADPGSRMGTVPV